MNLLQTNKIGKIKKIGKKIKKFFAVVIAMDMITQMAMILYLNPALCTTSSLQIFVLYINQTKLWPLMKAQLPDKAPHHIKFIAQKKNPGKYGVKAYILCNAENAYCIKWSCSSL